MVMWSTFGATKPIILVTDLAAVVGLLFISPSSEKDEFFDSLLDRTLKFTRRRLWNLSMGTVRNGPFIIVHYSRRFPMFVDNIVFII